MKTIKVETWLPIFSGFYGTIWESDSSQENEFQYINEKRAEKGLPPLDNDETIDWNYDGYHKEVAQSVAYYVSEELLELGMIADYSYQKLSSPREYNFANDSIHVKFSLNAKNKVAIATYLVNHSVNFSEYLHDHYTSYDGFISSYSNNPADWTSAPDETLSDKHKLGAVLNFILLNENGNDFEGEVYEDVTGHMGGIEALNYKKLLEVA